MIMFLGVAYAVPSGGVSNNTLQSLNGITVIITSRFSLNQAELFLIVSSQPASSTPCGWPSACNTVESAGDWALDVQITLNNAPATTTIYTITISGVILAGSGSTGASLSFSVPSTAAAGSTNAFVFDLGTTTLAPGFGFIIAVQ